MSKALITGATGFIGGRLASKYLEKGHSVRAFHLPGDPGAGALNARGAELFEGDISDFDSVAAAVSGVDVVFHCAAVVTDWAPSSLFEKVTVRGSENICRACLDEGVSRLVYVSTNDVFGTDESRVMDESFPLSPWSEPYPDYKIQAEKNVWKFHKDKGLPATMVYPCWVYGPGDQTFVPALADAILKKEMIFWRKDALVWPTYIENLVDLLLLISQDERAVGNGYLVHDGESDTLQNFCKGIAQNLGVKPPGIHIPFFAAYAAAWGMELFCKFAGKDKRPLLTTYTVKNLGSRLRFSIDKARKDLGWTPKTDYADGFKKTMEWLSTLDLENLQIK